MANTDQTLADLEASGKYYSFEYSKGKLVIKTWEPKPWLTWPAPPAHERPRCGAKCRNGRSCRRRVTLRPDGELSEHCHSHGALSKASANDR